MGGLRRWMPVTWATFWIGTLAIAGIPIFSGFFSKDEILWYSLGGPLGHWVFYSVGLTTAALTAFYMARLTFKTFHGEPRMSEEVRSHIHESPPSMSVVLVLLAVGATLAGLVNIPAVLGEASGLPARYQATFGHFLESNGHGGSEHHIGVIGTEQTGEIASEAAAAERVGFVTVREHVLHDSGLELSLMGLTVLVAALAIWGLARWWYVSRPGGAAAVARKAPWAYRLLADKYRVDELYQTLIIRPGMALSQFLWRAVDVLVIDGIVNGTAYAVAVISQMFRVLQSGYVRNYAAGMLAGAIILIWVLLR